MKSRLISKEFLTIKESLDSLLMTILDDKTNVKDYFKCADHKQLTIYYYIFEHGDNTNDKIEYWVILHQDLKMEMGLCTYRKRTKLERLESDDDLIRDSKDYACKYGNVPISRYLLKSNHEDDFHRITEALQFTEEVKKGVYIRKLPSVNDKEQLKEEIMPIISETFSKLLEMCRELNMYTI